MGKLENLEKRVKDLEIRISKLENEKKSKRQRAYFSKPSSLRGKIKQKINDIGIQHLITLVLKIKSKQTKSQIENTFVSWNKPIGSWFQGGNFNKRLLKKGIIMKDGIDKNDEELFSLTMRGVKMSDKLIEKYGLE